MLGALNRCRNSPLPQPEDQMNPSRTDPLPSTSGPLPSADRRPPISDLPVPASDRRPPELAVVYARCSTDQQDHSIRVQNDKIKAYLALNHLDTLPELQFEDEDVSGRIPLYERPGGKRAVDALRCGISIGSLSPASRALLESLHAPRTAAPTASAPAVPIRQSPISDPPTSVFDPATSGFDPATSALGRSTSSSGPPTSIRDPSTSSFGPFTSTLHPHHLVISGVDRLGRRARHILEFVEWAETHGYVLHFVDFGGMAFNTQDNMGKLILKMMITLLAMLAEFEGEMTRTRIRNTFANKRANGELCGKPAYGQRVVTVEGNDIKRVEPDPVELYWLGEMRTWRSQGWSYKRIADYLNSLGVPTKHQAGELVGCRTGGKKPASGRWSQGSVCHALTSHFARSLAATAPAGTHS